MSDEPSPFNPKADIYVSYTSQDQALLDELLKHLTSLQWRHITISSYHEGQISSIAQREEIESRMNSADVVVMLDQLGRNNPPAYFPSEKPLNFH